MELSPLDRVMAKFYRSLSACRFVEFDTSVICHVFMHVLARFYCNLSF